MTIPVYCTVGEWDSVREVGDAGYILPVEISRATWMAAFERPNAKPIPDDSKPFTEPATVVPGKTRICIVGSLNGDDAVATAWCIVPENCL